MSEAALAYLVERQAAEGLTGAAMAARLGLSETQWSHIKRGRSKLGLRHIERAIALYPDIVERFGPAAIHGEKVPA